MECHAAPSHSFTFSPVDQLVIIFSHSVLSTVFLSRLNETDGFNAAFESFFKY